MIHFRSWDACFFWLISKTLSNSEKKETHTPLILHELALGLPEHPIKERKNNNIYKEYNAPDLSEGGAFIPFALVRTASHLGSNYGQPNTTHDKEVDDSKSPLRS